MIYNKDFSSPPFLGKYFGTDGFRGQANVDVTALQAFKIGRFAGWYFGNEISGFKIKNHRPKIILGKDTRRSSYMLEYALASGLAASGADVYMLHVTTTPSVSYVTRSEEFDCGIMISASHNPFEDNGIKFINRYGEKIDTKTLAFIESYLSGELDLPEFINGEPPLASKSDIGVIIDYSAGRNRYIAYLISLASHSYKGLRIGLDTSNGASWMIAPAVFKALGATTYVINDTPDGKNINKNAGSTHIEALKNHVKENHLDIGFAFDGDADRCIAVDENGNEVDGDAMLYILAKRLKSKNSLTNNLVIPTVMSNSGLAKSLKNHKIDTKYSAVGDQNVYDLMCKEDSMLGGEKSGHIIIRKYATTGDGILTAIMILEEMMDRKLPLSSLYENLENFSQFLKNFKVKNKKTVASDTDILDMVEKINRELCDNGRILLRESGTEPVIRIMAESSDKNKCQEYISEIENIIRNKGYLSV